MLYNQTLWRNDPIPETVRIELEAQAGPDGDIRIEIFGDGEHHESGYVAENMLGGEVYGTRIRSKFYVCDTRFETAIQTDITRRVKAAFRAERIGSPYQKSKPAVHFECDPDQARSDANGARL